MLEFEKKSRIIIVKIGLGGKKMKNSRVLQQFVGRKSGSLNLDRNCFRTFSGSRNQISVNRETDNCSSRYDFWQQVIPLNRFYINFGLLYGLNLAAKNKKEI